MTFNTNLEIRSDLTSSLEFLRSQIAKTSAQLGTWLVAGNGAALYFLVSSATEKRIPTNNVFANVYGLFLAGASLAFVAMASTCFMAIPLISLITKMSNSLLLKADRDQHAVQLGKNNIGPPESFAKLDADFAEQMRLTPRRLRIYWIVFAVVIATYVLSALCLLVGLSFPLLGGLVISS